MMVLVSKSLPAALSGEDFETPLSLRSGRSLSRRFRCCSWAGCFSRGARTRGAWTCLGCGSFSSSLTSCNQPDGNDDANVFLHTLLLAEKRVGVNPNFEARAERLQLPPALARRTRSLGRRSRDRGVAQDLDFLRTALLWPSGGIPLKRKGEISLRERQNP
jgi:hypothetical protein